MQQHVVVDGSNIATEGRPLPSLKQLNEAVLAYIEEHPDTLVTVVVDATFGHRIATKEIAEFDDAIANNELVSPPAGAIGRGDAFVLSIAKKAHATILSNDSFQEFHGEHPWLFDDGRLVGGKPVPHVGWVFVARNPVRGPISRRAVKDTKAPRPTASRADGAGAGRPGALASEPMPVPSVPPPGRRGSEARRIVDTSEPAKPTAGRSAGGAGRSSASHVEDAMSPIEAPRSGRSRRGPRSGSASSASEGVSSTPSSSMAVGQAPIPAKGTFINELMAFLSFVEQHPVGSPVEITIDAYASHGAYATCGDARCYLPLRYMAHPAPRAARDVVKLGDTHQVVVVSFNPSRRGIDVALPGAVPAEVVLVAPRAATESTPASTRKPRSGRKATAAPVAAASVAVGGSLSVMPEAAMTPAALASSDEAPTRSPRSSRRRGKSDPLEVLPSDASATVSVLPKTAADGQSGDRDPLPVTRGGRRSKRQVAEAADSTSIPPVASPVSAESQHGSATSPRRGRARRAPAEVVTATTAPDMAAAPPASAPAGKRAAKVAPSPTTAAATTRPAKRRAASAGPLTAGTAAAPPPSSSPRASAAVPTKASSRRAPSTPAAPAKSTARAAPPAKKARSSKAPTAPKVPTAAPSATAAAATAPVAGKRGARPSAVEASSPAGASGVKRLRAKKA